MKILRIAAISIFSAGLVALLAGVVVACGSGDAAEEPTPTETPTEAPTATNTPSPTPTPTEVPPTPTPTPYTGRVARLQIPKFGVDSEIEIVGIDAQNRMEAPKDPLKTGWYGTYGHPGWPGNAVFSAHVNYFPNIKGPFNRLDEAVEGDQIIVVMGDGSTYTYEVVSNTRYLVSELPTGKIVRPDLDLGEQQITLITCGGQFVQTNPNGSGEYLHRDVVVAKRVS